MNPPCAAMNPPCAAHIITPPHLLVLEEIVHIGVPLRVQQQRNAAPRHRLVPRKQNVLVRDPAGPDCRAVHTSAFNTVGRR
eukprot:728307-Pyramimonas_sp.AAC.1